MTRSQRCIICGHGNVMPLFTVSQAISKEWVIQLPSNCWICHDAGEPVVLPVTNVSLISKASVSLEHIQPSLMPASSWGPRYSDLRQPGTAALSRLSSSRGDPSPRGRTQEPTWGPSGCPALVGLPSARPASHGGGARHRPRSPVEAPSPGPVPPGGRRPV